MKPYCRWSKNTRMRINTVVFGISSLFVRDFTPSSITLAFSPPRPTNIRYQSSQFFSTAVPISNSEDAATFHVDRGEFSSCTSGGSQEAHTRSDIRCHHDLEHSASHTVGHVKLETALPNTISIRFGEVGGHENHFHGALPFFLTEHEAHDTTPLSRHSSPLSLVDKEEGPAIGFHNSACLSEEKIAPIFKFQKKNGKVKVVNAFSLYTIFVCIVTCPLWALAMYIVDAVNRAFPEWDPHRTYYDKTGKIWCKTFLTLTNSYPTLSGDLERLKEKKTEDTSSCLFVANHASFLDIAVLCTVLDPVFKFMAKCDLKSFPFIGQQLTGGQHILIDRNDRRSQLRAFKDGVALLQSGVSLMAFPEGTRSKDGRLLEFKGGMFSMALKSKVPIVPISISNTHAIFPSHAFMPIQPGTGKLHVHVHEPIPVEGKSEKELAVLVRAALLSRLPLDQQPNELRSNDDDDDDD